MVNLPLLLADTRMYSNAGEVALAKDLVQLGGPKSTLNENDDLIELKCIEEIVQLSILLPFAKLDEILLKTVQCKFGLIIHIDLEWVSHEFLADGSDFLGQSGTEHHDLLFGWCSTEDLLNITAHV